MFNQLFKKEKGEPVRAKEEKQMQGSYFEQERPKLPANFAQSLMELEMQLEFVETYNM
jgi:hypothetical protein